MGRETLKQWGVEWKGVKQLQGEVLVLGEGAWGEWWSEEAGVVEVGVVRVGSLGGYAAGEYAAGGYGGVHHEGRGACVECLWRYGMQVVEEVEEMDVDVDQPPEGEEGEGYVGKGKGKEVVR